MKHTQEWGRKLTSCRLKFWIVLFSSLSCPHHHCPPYNPPFLKVPLGEAGQVTIPNPIIPCQLLPWLYVTNGNETEPQLSPHLQQVPRVDVGCLCSMVDVTCWVVQLLRSMQNNASKSKGSMRYINLVAPNIVEDVAILIFSFASF